MFDLIIKNGTALLSHPKNPFEIVEEETDIGIRDGKIVEIGYINKSHGKKIFSAKNLHVLPGLMDCQVHFREPGMDHKENFETGSKSALLGGMTAVFEMPNTSPPTTTFKALQEKQKKAQGRFYCDYAFFVGACPENKTTLHELEKSRGCSGIKIFMGSSTGGLLLNKDEDLDYVIKNSSRRISVHSEDEERLNERKRFIKKQDVSSHALWRDEQTALISTKKLIHTAQKYQKLVHVLHVTTEEEIHFLSQHKSTASVEVTPQHLTLHSPDCYKNLGSLVQMNPPIRSQRHLQALWKGLNEGVVDIIGSDHAPHTLEEKRKPYPLSPSGMPGVQTLLPLLLYHHSQQKISLKTIVQLTAVNPHRIFKIKQRGLIKKDFLANFTIVDLKKENTITKKWLAYKCGWSPFEGMKITGWPQAVILRGQIVMQESEILIPHSGTEIEFFSH